MTTKILTGAYSAAYDVVAPVTTLSIAATGYLQSGLTSAGVGSYTVVNNGGIHGTIYGISLAGGGVVTNAFLIDSASTVFGAGVTLGNGGTVTNNAGAAIIGDYGVVVSGQAGVVNNQGLIRGAGNYGVELAGGGLVTNGSATDRTATLRGTVGVSAGASATLQNFGTIAGSGTNGAGGYLKVGGLVTNGSASDTSAIIQGPEAGVAVKGAGGTVINYGTVQATGTSSVAVALEAGGIVTNGSATDIAALMRGTRLGVGIQGGPGTVNNFGSIFGGYDPNGAFGVYLINGGVVNNGSAKDITAGIAGSGGVEILGSGTINNFGTVGGVGAQVGAVLEDGGLIVNGAATDITALVQAYGGVTAATKAATVINFGVIMAGGGSSGGASQAGVLLQAGGSVTNGSSADVKALIEGGTFAVYGETIAATVSNFGDMSGTQVGILLLNGGKVTNGSAADTMATVSGGAAGVVIEAAIGTVSNFATITCGPLHGFGVALTAGGVVTNGGATDHAALIKGFIAVEAPTAAKITNSGTISGLAIQGSYGAAIGSGSTLINNAGALIVGYDGVGVGAISTLSNFGTIQSLGGNAVIISDPTGRLNAEAGSAFVGTIAAGGAVVDVVGGVATATAITSDGIVEGAGTLLLNGGTSLFGSGASLLASKIELAGAATIADVETTLSDSRIWDQTAGTLTVDSGDQISFIGTANSLTGAVTGLGAVAFVGGADSFTDLTLSAGKMTISKSVVTLAGDIDLTGTLTVTTPSLIIAGAGASLTGGGVISLSNTATNSIHGASATATLTNSDVILGAGMLGAGTMTLVNTASGVIESTAVLALTVDTGTNTIANAGLIEALTGGGVVVGSAVDNTGAMNANNGTLIVTGAVTGAGVVNVIGGVVSFASTFSENVGFGSTGRLVLSHSQTYGGTISGFSHTGTSSLDLTDIAHISDLTKATYAGNATGGILTVTDGTHTANIHFIGNYLTADWLLTTAAGGGTHVVDPTPAKPIATPLVAAMASFGAENLGGGLASSSVSISAPPLLAAHAHT